MALSLGDRLNGPTAGVGSLFRKWKCAVSPAILRLLHQPFHGCVSILIDLGRIRLKANMIAGPAWMLDCRSFVTATGAARGCP
jgi:hypothetical protein